MSLVDTRTDEVLPLSEVEARRLTQTIKLLTGSIADQVEKVTGLIAQAEAGRAWAALGYASWTAYCAAEFAGTLPRLERQARQELVASLTEAGMSSRAIAPIVGVSDRHVRRDQVGPHVPPDMEIVDAELVEDESPAPKPIKGRDGKSYSLRNRTVEDRAAAAEHRLAVIEDMGSRGMSSGQIADEIGHNEEIVRKWARDAGIEIVADKVLGKSHRRIDHNRIAQETVTALEGLVIPLRLINFGELDISEAPHWANSLTDSIRALNRFAKQIKELTQ